LSRRFLLLVTILVLSLTSSYGATFRFGTGNNFQMPDEDPYKVLGISKKDQNNMEVIKKRYRELAKKAHPDKNPDLDPTIANEKFHRINAAYEYLSNKEQKLYYDRRKNGSGTRYGSQKHNYNNNNNSRQRQEEILRRKQEEKRKRQEELERKKREEALVKLAREAQASMPKITSVQDLIDLGIVDSKSQTFRTNFLCVFVHNKKIESQAENDYLFPYPFGESNSGSDFDWTQILQTAKIRYNKITPLTSLFRIPLKPVRPTIVFVPAGMSLHKLRPQVYNHGRKISRDKFQTWVRSQLQTTVSIVNKNPESSPSFKVYYATRIDNNKWHLKTAGKHVAPGYMLQVPTKLSDRLVVLDESLNEFVGSFGTTRANDLKLDDLVLESVLLDSIVVTDYDMRVNVGTGYGTTRNCYDLALHCQEWLRVDPTRCQQFTTFAHSMCAKSCSVCIESPHFNGIHYSMLHTPLHKIPEGVPRTVFYGLREVAKFLQTMVLDSIHCWQMRRTVTVGFVVAGLLLGIQIVLLAQMMLQGGTSATIHHKNCPSLIEVGFWFYFTGVVACALLFVYHARPHDLFDIPGLVSFHWDLLNLWRASREIAFLFTCIGVASLSVCKTVTYPLFRKPTWTSHAIFLACLAIASYGAVIGISVHLDNERKHSAYMAILGQKWDRAIRYYKNVAAAFIVFGHLIGNTALTLSTYVRYKVFGNVYLLATIVNLVIASGLLSGAVKDRYFLQDFDHVTSMRMSAAIPCLVAGVVLGVTLGHRLLGAKRTPSKTIQPQEYPASMIKAKVD